MKHLARAVFCAALVLCAAGVGDASPGSRSVWTVTDVFRQARREYPAYAGIALVGMTRADQVLWTAYGLGGNRSVRHVFRWQHGTIADLGQLPRGMNTAALSDDGEIAGTDFNPSLGGAIESARCAPTNSFLWRRGKVTKLGTLGRCFGFVAGVNDRGEVALTGSTNESRRSPLIRALLWRNGKRTALGTLGGAQSAATAIGAGGDVLGNSQLSSGFSHGFLWQDGRMRDLGGMPGASYDARAINTNGQVAGTWRTTRNSDRDRAFFWQNGRLTDLGSPGGGLIDSMAINDRGQVIWTTQSLTGVMHGFLWQRGKTTDLGTLDGKSIAVSAINDRGQIVGTNAPTSKPYDEQHAFVWQNGAMIRLPGPAIRAYTIGIDPSGTHVVLGGPCCQRQLLLWARRG